MRQVEETVDEVARQAEGARRENARATQRGQETDYDFRLPPDVAEADRLRADDDVELNARQEDMAETQRRAAEALRRNEESLRESARSLKRTAGAVHGREADVRDVRKNVEQIREQVARARERVEDARVPEVDRGSGGG